MKFLNDYDYKKHYNIDIGLSILTNMKTNKEMTNIVIFCMLEVYWAKRDSNPHDINRYILSVLRLPFRHLPIDFIISK